MRRFVYRRLCICCQVTYTWARLRDPSLKYEETTLVTSMLSCWFPY